MKSYSQHARQWSSSPRNAENTASQGVVIHHQPRRHAREHSISLWLPNVSQLTAREA